MLLSRYGGSLTTIAPMGSRFRATFTLYLYIYSFIVGYCSSSWSSLEQKLRQIWFATYPRHGHTYDSSGFEHVFVGETDSTEVVGFHNWVQFHIQERERKLNYLGYVFSKQVSHKIKVI